MRVSKAFIFSLFFFSASIQADDSTFTRATLQAATASCLSEGCLKFRFEGTCFWAIKHRPFVETSAYVSHFLPDVVVNVFSEPDEDPYDEGRTIDSALYAAMNPILKGIFDGDDLGGGQNHAATYDELNEKVKDVSILPNPAVLELQYIPFLIPTLVNGNQIFYYDSIPDFFMWRLGLAEVNVSSLISSGVDFVGGASNPWGDMYAQEGTIDAANNYVDSAVIAVRAAGLVDQGGKYEAGRGREMPWQYASASHHGTLPYNCNTAHCHASHISVSTDYKNSGVKWQRIYPDVTNKAISFGEQDLISMDGDTGDAPSDINDGNYSWIMWRKYEGCIPHDGKYMFMVRF